MHATGLAVDANSVIGSGEFISNGDLTVHVRINDPDFDLSAIGEDKIDSITNRTQLAGAFDGPLKIMVSRGADILTLVW